MIKRILGWLWGFVEVVIIVYVVFITSCILCRNKYGFTQFGSYTMASINDVTVNYLDNSKAGNLLVVKNSNDIKEGDLIYYYAPVEEEYIIRSGVVTQAIKDDGNALYTLNDADKTSIASTRVLGKYSNQYENLGTIMDILESRLGFLFLVLLPIMIVFIYQIYEFVILIRYDKVEDDEVKEKKKRKKKLVEKEDKKEEVSELKEEKVDEKSTTEVKKEVEPIKEEAKVQEITVEKREEKIVIKEDVKQKDDDIEIL